MSIVVIGRHGLIGRRLLARLSGEPHWSTTHRSSEPGPQLDLAHPDAFDARRIAAGDFVVVCGAIAAPDRCAQDPEAARRVNVDGTAALARVAAARGARVVVFSSDTVYGDTDAPVDEAGPVRPVGPYAHMKAALEDAVSAVPQVRILRLSFVVHRADSFLAYLTACAARGAEAEVFDPFDRCAIDVEDVVDCVLGLRERWEAVPGPFVNVGGPALLSRLAMAGIVREHALPELRFRAVAAPPGFFDNRPARIAMRSPLLASILGRAPRAYADVVRRECLDVTP